MSWIDIANKLDNNIFRQALTDAVTDMCFYEGDETTDETQQYIDTVEKGDNTVELDQAIMDRLLPYMENAILTYGTYLIAEGEADKGNTAVAPAEEDKVKRGQLVPADKQQTHTFRGKKAINESDMSVAGKKTGVALTKTAAGPHSNIDMNGDGRITPEDFKGEGDYEFALKHGIEGAKAKTQPLTGNTDLGKVTHAGIIHKKKVHAEFMKHRGAKGSGKDAYYPEVVKDAVSPSS